MKLTYRFILIIVIVCLAIWATQITYHSAALLPAKMSWMSFFWLTVSTVNVGGYLIHPLSGAIAVILLYCAIAPIKIRPVVLMPLVLPASLLDSKAIEIFRWLQVVLIAWTTIVIFWLLQFWGTGRVPNIASKTQSIVGSAAVTSDLKQMVSLNISTELYLGYVPIAWIVMVGVVLTVEHLGQTGPGEGICSHCGYSKSAGRCPECGKV